MPETLFLYNTLSRSVEKFSPLNPKSVGLYCCGPTVYNFQHIGNMKTYIFEDVLVRTLRSAGYNVNHVLNITDVGHLVSDSDEGEDKMMVAMRREGKTSHDIAAFYTDSFFKDCEKLNITKPNIICKATDHIGEMISLIKRLEERGLTYVAGGNVYFDVEKFPEYGKLAKLDLTKLKAGARIDVDSNKKSPFDFVLWFTKSKFENQELQWDSPWGRGYPGWHIECSAMSMKYLGDEFDIHCGGIDHIPVHHTNEIAQSEGATGKRWVSIWMHSEFILLNKEKMSKSKGGFLTVSDVEEKGYESVAYRYLCLTAHYRSQLNFSWDALDGASNSVKKLRHTVSLLKDDSKSNSGSSDIEPYLKEFHAAMWNDLNTPQALATVWSCVSNHAVPPQERIKFLERADEILGLGVSDWSTDEAIPDEVLSLAAKREDARKAKDFKLADELRGKISQLGFTLEDSKDGPKVRKG